jgi:hypothetical protein
MWHVGPRGSRPRPVWLTDRRVVLRKLLVVAAAVAACLGLSNAAQPRSAQACGLPDSKPLWVDYVDGTVPFSAELFGRPGIIAATGGELLPPQLRNLGAQTVYWEMHLGLRVGTTAAPAAPDAIPGVAQRMFDRAVSYSGCATPFIALNELNGAGTTTPWSPTNAQYRANVLTLMRELAARGAHVFLLINSRPYTDNEARDWWLQAAQVASLVPEVYYQAPKIAKQGVILGSRQIRQGYRQAIRNFTEIGIPASKLGLVIGFQSGPGAGGREGLQPSSRWFEIVKLQTLAAKTVAAELGISTVWTWGWGTFTAAGADPDKRAAACVYLWTRSADLCDAPALLGADFDPDLTAGQISALPVGAQCSIDGRTIPVAAIQRVAAVTKDRDVALTILYERVLDGERVSVAPDQVLAAEQALIEQRFGGSRAEYLAALRQAHATLEVAHGAIADALGRARITTTIPVGPPSPSQVAAFYNSYSNTLARYVEVKPGPSWLGYRTRGFAVAPAAPADLFDLPLDVDSTLVSSEGIFTVHPLENSLPLGAIPLETARFGIGAALRSFARGELFDRWETSRQALGLSRLICLRDDLPSIGSVRLSSYLPFLDLG